MIGYLRCGTADLMSLLAAVAKSSIVIEPPVKKSPIVAAGAAPADGCFADWCASRQGADIDAEILAWIASHGGSGRLLTRALH
jgi:hypothetical protein